ncbi:Chaperone of endosialidase [Flexibacter flexilis DSM 6793]|uniref:Chaperone of endosialidase n=1 Tax=Flexibacter flexilis DSM 6793 TaxID=927664 RepID=A0A1I1FA42_9BACT|nr:tail fiber domain-containing protein [Flexibacter flexilis]SFB93960.1 Chaperone of endosialidase [Flexibacter flexilis DSM 6793]
MKLRLSSHWSRYYFLLLGFGGLFSIKASAQNSVGIGTSNPNANAVLELKPLGKQGFIMPRLNASDTLSWTLSPKEKGLVFFDTTSTRFFVYDGAYWKAVGSGAAATGSGWELNSGVLYPQDLANVVSVGSSTTDNDTRLYARNDDGLGIALYGDSRATLPGTTDRIGVRGNAQTDDLTFSNVYGAKFTARSTNSSPTVVGAYMSARGSTGSASYGGFSEIESSNSLVNYGFRTNVQSSSLFSSNYGMYANISGDGTNYGIYSAVSGTGANYAGAFVGGGVGIGTSTPRRLLHVAGGVQIDTLAGVGVRMVVADADGSLFTQEIPSGGGGSAWSLDGNTGIDQDTNFIGTIDKKRLNFRTNNAPRLTIDPNDGAVSILQNGADATDLSTQSPSAELRLEGSYWNSDAGAEQKDVFRIQNIPDADEDNSGWLQFRSNNNQHLMSLHKNGGMLIGHDLAANFPPFNGLAVEGYVGIGTTTPSHHLEIYSTYNPTVKVFNADAWQAASLTASGYESILEFKNKLILMSNSSASDVGNGSGNGVMRVSNNGIVIAPDESSVSASAWLHVNSDGEGITTRIENTSTSGSPIALDVDASAEGSSGIAARFWGGYKGIEASAQNEDGTGGWFKGGATGVRGYADGNGSESGNTGLIGMAENNTNGNIGASGWAYGNSGTIIGLKGIGNGNPYNSYGVWAGTSADGGIAGSFIADGSADVIGVYGKAPSDANNWAGKFDGKVHVTNGLLVGTEDGSDAFSVNGKLKINPYDGDMNFNEQTSSIIFPTLLTDTEEPMIYMYNTGDIGNNKGRYLFSYSQDNKKTGLAYDASSLRSVFRFVDNSTETLYNVLNVSLHNHNVGINVDDPSHALHVSGDGKIEGDFYVTGNAEAYSFISSSDRRYKKDIRKLSGALTTIKQLRGVNYLWRKDEFKDKKFDDRLQVGFIAQEVEAIVPELVHTDSKGFKAVNYAQFTPILVEALKEQQALIESQAQQIQQLKADLGILRSLQEDVAHLKAEWAGSTAKK